MWQYASIQINAPSRDLNLKILIYNVFKTIIRIGMPFDCIPVTIHKLVSIGARPHH